MTKDLFQGSKTDLMLAVKGFLYLCMCFPQSVYLVVHVCSSVHILYLIKTLLKFFCLILLIFLQRTRRQTVLTLLELVSLSLSTIHYLPTITIFPSQPLGLQCHLDIMRCDKILVKSMEHCTPDYEIIFNVMTSFYSSYKGN